MLARSPERCAVLNPFQEPKPEQIRPYAVLQQTLQELKKKWKDKAPYNWVCNQFKSLRQDLTVRRISRVPNSRSFPL
jgi:hypothetical protein